nr:SDR family NAD(P)-dependent oxidoreductase [Leptolyngbya sp. FACHB-671]
MKNKVSFITGAGSGIGQATAVQFSREGAIAVVVDRNLESAKKTQHLQDLRSGTRDRGWLS